MEAVDLPDFELELVNMDMSNEGGRSSENRILDKRFQSNQFQMMKEKKVSRFLLLMLLNFKIYGIHLCRFDRQIHYV